MIIDSFQAAGWDYPETEALIKRFPENVSSSSAKSTKGQPMGKPAQRLKYYAGVKVRVSGYKAYCQGRFIPAPESITLCGQKEFLKQPII